MSIEPRMVAPDQAPEDTGEQSLRPLALTEFIGQQKLRENLGIFIEAAKARGEALDHALFYGPPGLGKTTLSQIVARELGVGFRATSGPVIARAGDLAALLTNLQPRDVLFIDEIHRLSPAVEEILYPAMEDFQLDLIIGEGPAARSVRIDLPKFTLVGATTRLGMITTPLRERFGIPLRLNFYTHAELELIVRRGAKVLGLDLADSGAAEIARRARGTPRVAGRLLRRVRDFAAVAKVGRVEAKLADAALTRLEVDQIGLDAMDRRYLTCIAENYDGGPVGVETMAAALSEQRDTIGAVRRVPGPAGELHVEIENADQMAAAVQANPITNLKLTELKSSQYSAEIVADYTINARSQTQKFYLSSRDSRWYLSNIAARLYVQGLSPADTGLTVNGIAVGDVEAIEVFPGGYTLGSSGDTFTFSKTKVVVESLSSSTDVYSIKVQLSDSATKSFRDATHKLVNSCKKPGALKNDNCGIAFRAPSGVKIKPSSIACTPSGTKSIDKMKPTLEASSTTVRGSLSVSFKCTMKSTKGGNYRGFDSLVAVYGEKTATGWKVTGQRP